jgi:thiol-disulfide isomerase/thioredoxin
MASTTDQSIRAAFPELGRLEWSYAGRFLALARKNPRAPTAIDALGGLVANRFTPPEAALAAGTLGAMAEPQLFVLRELAVGKPAPEVEGQDVDGNPFRLSDYRGRVVVLTFSGNWCGPCKAIYPHERALVERMRGRPFALLSVNTDEDKETLRKSLESHEITWRCWWEGGAERPNCARWRLTYIPMVYIFDARGIIRAKDVRGKGIDDVVDQLVRETETHSGNSN